MAKKTTPKEEEIIRKHVLWAMGAGIVPIPIIDVMAVTTVQLDMLQQLSELYGLEFTENSGKSLISAIAVSSLSRYAASFVKAIPGVGSIVGGLSMAALSDASTYALGKMAVNYFSQGQAVHDINPEEGKKVYEEAFEEGKQYAKDLEKERKQAKENTKANPEAKEDAMSSEQAYEKLQRLGELRKQGVLSEEEFAAKKAELLKFL